MVANVEKRAVKVFLTDHPYNPDLVIWGNFPISGDGEDFFRVSAMADVMTVKRTIIGAEAVDASLGIYQIPGVKEVILTREYILVMKYVPEEWDEIEEKIRKIIEDTFEGIRFIRSSKQMPGLPVTA
jgi:hypothetical protein